MFSSLMSLEADAPKTEPAPKKARPSAPEIYPMLCQVLHTLSSAGPTQINGDIEIEVRIGLVVDGNRRLYPQASVHGCAVFENKPNASAGYDFKPGIDEDQVDKVKRALLSDKYIAEKLPPQIMHIDDRGNRWEVIGNDIIVKPEKKTRFGRYDMPLLAHAYDIRIDAAVESSIINDTGSTNGIDASRWSLRRSKRRITYRSPSSMWHIDMTEVETSRRITAAGNDVSPSEVEYELEVELSQSEALRLTSLPDDGPHSERKQLISKAATELFRLIYSIIPSNLHIPDLPLIKLSSEDITTQIKRINANISSSKSHLDFMGAMPISMSRKSLQNIMHQSYYVTEKSDGVRKLLYVVSESGVDICALVDRAKNIEKFDGGSIIGSSLKTGTVLDGELVYNLTEKKYIFLVFDMLAINGEIISFKPFRDRLDLINKHMRAATTSSKHEPIVPKAFFDKRLIGELLSRIRFIDGHRVYLDETCRGRHHRTDGLIFQPDKAYTTGTDSSLVKWKYADLMTVDLQVAASAGSGVRLLCLGPENILIDCTAHSNSDAPVFGKFSDYRLQADLHHFKMEHSARPPIAEVAYDAASGVWRYFHFREDKTTPNHISTVLSVFMEQAEGLDVEELEYRLLARSEAENDFGVQMSSMKNKALAFQRKRTKEG